MDVRHRVDQVKLSASFGHGRRILSVAIGVIFICHDKGAQTAHRRNLPPRKAREFPSNRAGSSAEREFSRSRHALNVNQQRGFGGKGVRLKRKRATRFRSRAIDLVSLTNGHGPVKGKLSGTFFERNGWNRNEFAPIERRGARSAFESESARAAEGH
jgi:hypothetical protein